MQEIKIKTHLIVTDVHDEYAMHWTGKFMDIDPLIENDLPVFVIIGAKGRIELNTANTFEIENAARSLTKPTGRAAVTRDLAQIFLKDNAGKEVLMGHLIHTHIRKYAPMYDTIQCR